MNSARPFSTALFFFVAIALAFPVCAEGGDESEPWQFDVAPMYLWAVHLDGTATTGPAATDVKMNFGDVANALESMFTLRMQANKGQYGALFDTSYMKLTGSQAVGPGNIDVSFSQTMTELLGYYSIFLQEDTHLDFLAGFRATFLDLSIGSARSIDKDVDWVDPVVGLRLVHQISDDWKMSFRGDVGGFGIGADHALNGELLFDYQAAKHFSLVAGFRAMDVYYRDDGFKYDLLQIGPAFGFKFDF